MRRANWYHDAYIATLKAEQDETAYAEKVEVHLATSETMNFIQAVAILGEGILIAVHWK